MGREDDLRILNGIRERRTRDAPQLITVTGAAGVGKTTLVVRWLGSLADSFPDGQLYANFRASTLSPGSQSPDEVLSHFLRSVGAAPPFPDRSADRIALWRTWTADARLAILLDGAVTAAQVRPLLPSSPDSLVVVTSRQRLTGLLVEGAVLHHVRPLQAGHAVELLSLTGGGDRVTGAPEAARRVVDLCDRLPLAICVAGARLATRPSWSVGTLADALSRGSGPLETLRVEGRPAVRLALDESYRGLPREVARTYRCLGMLPSACYSAHMTAAACRIRLAVAEGHLDTLVEASLLEDSGHDSYTFHDLVRAHARDRSGSEDSEEERRSRLLRFAGWCLTTATAAEALLAPSHRNLARTPAEPPSEPVAFEGEKAALAWLEAHSAMLMDLVRECSAQGWHELTWQLVDALWPMWHRLRPVPMWVEAHDLGLRAAREAADRVAEGRMLTSGAIGLRHAGRLAEAADWHGKALRIAREDNDPRQQAQALNGLGTTHLERGDYGRAESCFAEAYELRLAVGYTRGAALSLLRLGETALALEDFPRAVGLFTRAHADLTAEGDTHDAARALALLGRAKCGAGDTADGEPLLRRALEAFRAAGSRHWEARAWELLGQCAEQREDGLEARDRYGRSRALYEKISPADTERISGRLRRL
ncbi:tetratricopeptide repeat protein [Streptomyces sp. NPDC054796]